jgi:hypothetical protein
MPLCPLPSDRKVTQNLVLRHPGCEMLEDVAYGDAHGAYARLAAAFSGLDRNDVALAHSGTAPLQNRL